MTIKGEIYSIVNRFENISNNSIINKLSNINKEIKLSKRQEAVLVGVVLGDGYIQKVSEGSYRFKTIHSHHQKSQIYELAKIFSNFNPGISKTIKKLKDGGTSDHFTMSFSNSVLKKYYDMFYKPKKIVSQEILNLFTDESWAYYFFDNGSFHNSNSSQYYRLHTEAFGEKGVKLIQSALTKKGFKSNINKRKNGQLLLNFSTESTKKISDMLKKYASKDLKYKLMSKNAEKIGMITQTVILSKDKFKTKEQAIKWMEESSFKKFKVDETSTSFRFRQIDPKKIKEGTFRTKEITDGVSIVVGIPISKMSKFSSIVYIKNISKMGMNGSYLPKDIKSDLDIQIPMNVELWILSTGPNRDGIVREQELEESIETWEGIDIIRHHDMKVTGITQYGIHEEFGVTDNVRIKEKDGKKWIVADGRITNRPVAYNMYLRELRGEPIEISAEYSWFRDESDPEPIQRNIQGAVISLVDRGHIKGNQIKPKRGKIL